MDQSQKYENLVFLRFYSLNYYAWLVWAQVQERSHLWSNLNLKYVGIWSFIEPKNLHLHNE